MANRFFNWLVHSAAQRHNVVICWYGLVTRVTSRMTCNSVHKVTCCVCSLIPRDVVALMIVSFKIICYLPATDAGQPSVFVQIVEVLGNLQCNSLICTKFWPFSSFTLSKYWTSARLPIYSLLVRFSWDYMDMPHMRVLVTNSSHMMAVEILKATTAAMSSVLNMCTAIFFVCML